MRALDPLHDEYVFTASDRATGKAACSTSSTGSARRLAPGSRHPVSSRTLPPRIASITTSDPRACDLLVRSREASARVDWPSRPASWRRPLSRSIRSSRWPIPARIHRGLDHHQSSAPLLRDRARPPRGRRGPFEPASGAGTALPPALARDLRRADRRRAGPGRPRGSDLPAGQGVPAPRRQHPGLGIRRSRRPGPHRASHPARSRLRVARLDLLGGLSAFGLRSAISIWLRAHRRVALPPPGAEPGRQALLVDGYEAEGIAAVERAHHRLEGRVARRLPGSLPHLARARTGSGDAPAQGNRGTHRRPGPSSKLGVPLHGARRGSALPRSAGRGPARGCRACPPHPGPRRQAPGRGEGRSSGTSAWGGSPSPAMVRAAAGESKPDAKVEESLRQGPFTSWPSPATSPGPVAWRLRCAGSWSRWSKRCTPILEWDAAPKRCDALAHSARGAPRRPRDLRAVAEAAWLTDRFTAAFLLGELARARDDCSAVGEVRWIRRSP